MPKSIDKVNQNGGLMPLRQEDLLELIHQVMHLVRSRQQQTLRSQGEELPHMEIKVLGYFVRHPGATLSDLSKHSGKDKAQLTRLIKDLRERGLLLSEPDASDRRNQRLTVSPDGMGLMAALDAQLQVVSTLAIQGLSAADQAELRRLLTQVQANLLTVA